MNPDLRKQSLCSYIVSVDLSEKKINCNCKMFEFVGILCSHILKVMSYIGIDAIPPHYILKRWTKNAKKVALSSGLDLVTNNGLATSNTQRFESLNLRAQKVIIEGSRSAQAYQVACQKIDLLANELAAMNLTTACREGIVKDHAPGRLVAPYPSQFNMEMKGFVLMDPPQSQCKGRKRPSRIKPSAEVRSKSFRTCKRCQKKGNNIRTCKEVICLLFLLNSSLYIFIYLFIGFFTK